MEKEGEAEIHERKGHTDLAMSCLVAEYCLLEDGRSKWKEQGTCRMTQCWKGNETEGAKVGARGVLA